MGILIFFLSGNGMISAKSEKPGATLVVQKLDGQTVRGELLEVKDGGLTLLVYENTTKMTIRLDELGSVRIEKKSAFVKGLGIGILAGAATGALLGFLIGDDEFNRTWGIHYTAQDKALRFGGLLAGAGGIIGGSAGALSGTDKLITLNALLPEKTRRLEARLASLARFKPDPIAEFRRRSPNKPE